MTCFECGAKLNPRRALRVTLVMDGRERRVWMGADCANRLRGHPTTSDKRKALRRASPGDGEGRDGR